MIVGAGTFGASLAWWLAGRGDEVVLVDQFEPGRPAGDLRWRDAADPLRARGGRRLHGDGAARADAVARARGGVRRRAADRDRRVLVRARRERVGGRVRADAQEARHPDRALVGRARRPSASRASTATTSRGCCTSPRRACCAPRRRSRRSSQQAQARGATLVQGKRDPRRRVRVVNGKGSRATASCGAAAAGCASSSPTSCSCGSRCRSCSSSTAGRPGATRPPGSTTTAPPTARPTSTSSASRSRGTTRARRSTPTPTSRRPPTATETARPRLRRRPLPRAGQAPLAGSTTCRYELSADSHFIAAPHPEHAVACGSSAAAPATASSTAPRWPSGSPTPGTAATPLPRPLRARRARQGHLVQERGLELLTATNHGPVVQRPRRRRSPRRARSR